MTVKAIEKNTQPTNANRKQVSELKNLINLASKTDKQLEKLKITKSEIGNSFVKYYANIDLEQFKVKQQKDCIDNNIYLRLKGFKNHKTAKPLTGSAKTMTSVIKAYIEKVGKIDKGLTYTELRKAVNALNKPTESAKRKQMLKFINALSDEQLAKIVELAKK